MERNKIILNGIFYLVVTIIFLILIIKEKSIGEWIRVRRDAFSDRIVMRFGWEGTAFGNGIKKLIALIESFGSAIILVLIIQKIYLGNFVVPTGSMIPTIMPKDRLFGNMVIYKFTEPKREDIIVFKEPIQNKVLYTKRVMGLPGEKVAIHDNHLFVNDNEITTRKYSALGLLGAANYWVVPKRGDVIEIIPGANYKRQWEERNFDIDKIQKVLVKNPGEALEILPNLEVKVNGISTGMILDVIHDKKYIKDILEGKTIKFIADEDYFLVLGDNTNYSYDSRMWGFVKASRIEGKALIRFWPLNRIEVLK